MGTLDKEQNRIEEASSNQNKKFNEGIQKVEKEIGEINQKLANHTVINPETANEKENEELRLVLKLLQDKVGSVEDKVDRL
jgi:uncharacterized protein YfkK (UPF0435 family)